MQALRPKWAKALISGRFCPVKLKEPYDTLFSRIESVIREGNPMGALKRPSIWAGAIVFALMPHHAFAQLDGETEAATWSLFCETIAEQQDGTNDMCGQTYKPAPPPVASVQPQPQQPYQPPVYQQPAPPQQQVYTPPARAELSELPQNAWAEAPVQPAPMAEANAAPEAPFTDEDFDDDGEKWWLIGSGIGTTLLMVLGVLIAL